MSQRGWLILTPEEWVRRHVVGYLVECKGVPPTSIREEYPVELNGQPQRADIVVFGPDAKPALLVECKAPEVAVDSEVVSQAVRYNSIVRAPTLMVTNGLVTKVFEVYCRPTTVYRLPTNIPLRHSVAPPLT